MISKPLVDSYINHEEFVLVNNVLRGHNEMEEEIKNPETFVKFTIYDWYKQRNAWKNGVEIIIDNDGILWLNEKHIDERLDNKRLPMTAT